MSVLGAVAAAVSVVLVVLGLTPRSRVAARLNALRRPGPKRLGRLGAVHVIAPATLRASGFSIAIEQLVAAKIALALVGALLAAVAALLVPIGPLVVAAAAYGGFILPTVVVERRAALRRIEAESATASFVEWTHALVVSGRPVDSPLITLSRPGTGN